MPKKPTEELSEAIVATQSEYQKIQEDVRETAVRAVRNNEEGMANHNLHWVSAINDPNGDPAIAKVDNKLRPGSREVERPSVEYMRPDEFKDLDDHVLDDRMGWSASPFVDEEEIDVERPKENVMSEQDIWVFDKDVERILEDEVDFDALGADIRQSRNIPKNDLSVGDEKDIDDVEKQKVEVSDNKESLIAVAKEIVRKVVGAKADQVPFHTKTPMEIYHYVDDVVEGAGNIGQAKMVKLLEDVGTLGDAAMELKRRRERTEDNSIETFASVLDTPGFGMPSTVAKPEDAITKHGVATEDYLFNA